MPHYIEHTIISGVISAIVFVVLGFWAPLPLGLIPSDGLISGGLVYLIREKIQSNLADKKGWQYPLALSVVLVILGRILS